MSEQKKKLLEQLDALKIFPKNKLVKALQKQIRDKLAKLERKEPAIIQKPKKNPNQARSGKLKRYHNYIRQIRNNFPYLSYNQIRSQFAKRKQGQQVDIPDVVWQNPSP
jgi:phage I-like protein